MPALNTNITSTNEDFSSAQIEAALLNFLDSLSNQNCSNATIRNYRSDIRQFYKHVQIEELKEIFTKSILADFIFAQKQKGLKDSSVTRKIASITQFALWSKQEGLISQDVAWLTQATIESLLKKTPFTAPKTNLETSPTTPIKSTVTTITKSPAFLKLFNSKKTQTEQPKEPVVETKQPKKEVEKETVEEKKISTIFSTPIKHKAKKVSQTASNFILPYLNLGLIVLFFVGLGFLGYNQLVTETPDTLAYPSSPVSASRVLSFQGRLTDTAQNPITTSTSMEFKIWDQLTGGTEGTCDGTNDCEYKTSTCSVTPDQDGIFNVGIGDDCGSEINEEVFSENAALWLEVVIASETLTPRQPVRTVPFAINSETVQGYPISASEAATVNTLLVMDAGGFVTLGENSPTLHSTSGTFTISGSAISLSSTGDLLFSDDNITNLPLTVADTAIDAALGQGIVDAINDVYGLTIGGAFFDQTNNLIYPTEYWNDEIAVGGNSTASADIRLAVDGAAVFNDQGNDADFRVEGSGQANALFVQGSDGYVGIGTNSPSRELEVIGSSTTYIKIDSPAGAYLELDRAANTNSAAVAFQTAGSSSVHLGLDNDSTEFFHIGDDNVFTNKWLTIDTTTGGVGIGTVTPTSTLDIAGANGSNSALNIDQLNSGDILTASASGVSKFTIDNTGSITLIDVVAHTITDTSGNLELTSNSTIISLNDSVNIAGSITSLDGVAHTITDTTGDLELTSNSTNISLNDNVTFAGTTTLNSVAYTWPGADGTNGQVLSTDAGGTLSWATVLTDTPSIGAWTHDDHFIYADDYWADDLIIGGNSTASADIQLYADGSAVFNEQGSDVDFRVEGVGQANALFVQGSDGFVGIGTNSPSSLLEVSGTGPELTRFTANSTTGSPKLSIFQTTSERAYLQYQDATLTGGSEVLLLDSDDNIVLASNNTEALRIDSSQQVNIGGDATPNSLFNVGSTSQFQIDSTGSIIAIDGIAHSIYDVAGDLAINSAGGQIEIYDPINVGGGAAALYNYFGTSTAGSSVGDSAQDLYIQDELEVDGTTTFGNVTYTWPGADGSTDAALTTNGAGTLSWTDSSALGAWTHDDHFIYADDYWQDDLIIGGNSTASADIQLLSDGSAIFNEQASDVDFRIEGVGEANALFVQGSDGFVGIGEGTPDHQLDVEGNIGIIADGYLNWGDTDGTAGYGFRDSSGTLQYKYSSGVWTDVGIAINTYWQSNAGALSPISLTTDVNLGATATASAKISLAGSLTRGMSAVVINQTESQDILTASASGVTKFTVQNNGNLSLENAEYITNITDDILVFGGSGGTSDTDLSIDLDGSNPVLYSTAGLGIEINDRLYIGTNNRYFYDEAGQLSFSDDLGIDASLAVGTVNSTGNVGEIITSGNIILDNQKELQLREDSGSGSNYTGFKAPTTLGGDLIYTLPAADGGVGNVLTTNGSGTLSWNVKSAFWQENDGALSPSSLTTDINLGATATSSAKISLAGSLTRGMAALIVNQTENQDILTASSSGTTQFRIDNSGDVALAAGNYVNWGTVLGTTGYGFRDSGGTVQFKNSGGAWADIGVGGGSGGSDVGYWELSAGSISPFFPTTDVNFGDSASASAKVSIAGSLTRGRSALIVNQTENQDIFTASSSGSTKFVIDNDGNVDITGDLDVSNQGAFGNAGAIIAGVGLNVDYSFTDTSGTAYTAYFRNQADAVSASTTNHYSAYGESRLDTTNGANTLTGTFGGSTISAAGTVVNARGLYGNAVISNATAGVASNLIGAELYTDVEDGTTNAAYGAFIYTPLIDTGSINTAGYGIYVADATAGSYSSYPTEYGIRIAAIDNAATNNYGFWGDAGDWILDEDGDGSVGGTTGGGDIFLGEGQDLALYHDGTNSYITNNTGDLVIAGVAGSDIIVNEAGASIDFRVEGSGLTHALFVQGSNGYVGINEASPDHAFDIGGNMGLAASSYFHWGDTDGSAGYGFRDSTGTLQYKNDGGSWVDIGVANNVLWQQNDGVISPSFLTDDINLGNVATASAKISLAGSLDRGKAAVMINQTEDQDIFTASSSGFTRFTIDYGGNATTSGSLDINDQLNLGSFASDPTAMGDGSIYYNTTDNSVYLYNGSSWGALGGGGGSSNWQLNAGSLSPLSTGYEINLGHIATDSAKISLAGSLDRGKAAVIINQTEAQDIFTASSSGTTRLTLNNSGQLSIGDITPDSSALLEVAGNIQIKNGANIGATDRNAGLQLWSDEAFGMELHYGQSGNSAGWATALYGRADDDTALRLGSYATDSTDQQDFTELMTIMNSGNIGIGDVTPEGLLDVEGAAKGQALFQLNEIGDQDIIAASVAGNTRFRVDSNGYTHAQRFADLSNSAYYLDPAATGMSLNTAGDGTLGGGEIFLYDANTYVSGDGTDLTFKDSYLSSEIALSESGTTQLHAGFTMNSIVAALNELMNISLGDSTNIALNSFRQQEQNDLLYQLLEDGVADEFEGLTGIDVTSSSYTYDATNDYFSRANPTSDIVHNSQALFDTGTNKENVVTAAAPTIELAYSAEKGDGSDGDITVSTSKNLNSDVIGAGRIFADGIAYNINGIATNAVSAINTPHGIEVGDEVLLINLQGDPSSYSSVGAYEFLTVSSVSGLNIAFSSSVTKTYGVGGNANLSGQDIIIQRVPNYGDVTISSGGTITSGEWDNLATSPTTPTGTAGDQTGIIAFRSSGKVDVQSGGSISASGLGFKGGVGDATTAQDYTGGSNSNENDTATTTPLAEGGGGGGGVYCHGGGGGGYGTAGTDGIYSGTSCTQTANAGGTFGDANLGTIYLGSAGGGGAAGYNSGWTTDGGDGGDGGGIIFITANEIDSSAGSILANGDNGVNGGAGSDIPPGGGGGGAGGSIYLKADVTNVSGTITSSGGTGGTTYTCGRADVWCNGADVGTGGAGGVGIIKIDSASNTGTTTPTFTAGTLGYYENYGIFTSDELNAPNTISFDEFIWTEILNTYGEVQVMTRSGGTNDATDGSWEAWRPIVTNTNELIIDNMDVHGNLTGYTPIQIRERTETQFAAGDEKTRVVETGDLDGQIDLERYIDNGDGADGDITVSTSKNLNTDIVAGGRSYADAISYTVSSISSNSLVASATVNGIVAGDEVLLINLGGDATNYDNVGESEFLKVDSVSGTTINFEEAISNVYGVGSNADLTGQNIIVQRVPQYYNVTIQSGGTITADDWDGTDGGVLVFRAAGTVDVQSGGSIDMDGKGYTGGAGSASAGGTQGEAKSGAGSVSTSPHSEGGGGGGAANCQGGGGGGYGSAGGIGVRPGTSCGLGSNQGATFGDANLASMSLGTGGGGGGVGYSTTGGWIYSGGAGGDGGGIIYITANEIDSASGTITSDGGNGGNVSLPGGSSQIPAGGGGGGTGGSIYLLADTSDVSGTVTSSGGAGGTTWTCARGDAWCNLTDVATGGAGGDGRIRIDANRNTGTTSPTLTDGTSNNDYHRNGIFTSDELATTNASSFDNMEWVESLGNVGEIQVLTRSGNTSDSTDGTWEDWKPNTGGTNTLSIANMDTHTNWTGTNMTVAEGDTARNVNYYEDEDEATVTNTTKMSTSTQDGYAERDLGGGSEVDLSNYDYVSFWIRSDVTSDKFTFSMGENAGNELSEKVNIDNIDTWQKVYWDISDIAVTNRNAIRYLRINNDEIPAVVFHLDNIEAGRFIRDYSGEAISSTVNNYIQYRAILTTTDVTDGPTLEEITTNYKTSGTNTVVAEGDVTRDLNLYEDEDEGTATNITKISFAEENGYVNRDLGGGSEVDLSQYDYVSFWIRSSEIGKKFLFGMGETGYAEETEYITIDTADTWQKVYWDISDITGTSRDAIRYFRLTYLDTSSATVYLDDLVADSYLTDETGSIISSSANEYIQYRLFLTTTTNTVTPTVTYTKTSYTDQLGHTDGSQSDFDTGTDKFQSESSTSGTLNISANTPNTGTGADGSINVTATTDINTDVIASGRAYADGVVYSASAISGATVTTSASPNGIIDGDEVILINLQGAASPGYTNVGNYEFLTVSSVNGTTLTFTSSIANTYGESTNSDLSGQKIIIQRVPQYNNVTVVSGGTLTATDWAGTSGGVLIFRATGDVSIEGGGFITMDGKGYRGGAGSASVGGTQGETTQGTGTANTGSPLLEGGGGGGAGGGANNTCQGGGGASYVTAGGQGVRPGTNCLLSSNESTNTYGSADLTKLYLGSAGGGGGAGYSGGWNDLGEEGGDGGGIIYIAANDIDVEDGIGSDGTLSTDGNQGGIVPNYGDIPAGGGGGGAGGSMYLKADTVSVPVNTTAGAGAGGTTYTCGRGDAWCNLTDVATGGIGSVGRVKIDANTITGTTTPTYTAGTNSGSYYPFAIFTSDEINTAGATSFDLLSWTESLGGAGEIQMMTRSGATADSTDGTWESWKPLDATNEAVLNNANTHGDWVGYAPEAVIDDTRAEFDEVSVEKHRVSSTTTPTLKLDRYIDDGDGSDGSVTISSTVSINTALIATGRTGQADGIAYKIDAATASGTTVGTIETDAPNGLAVGDEVLLINLQGGSGDVADVGNYEFLKIASISNNDITFKTSITNSYDGVTPADQKVVIQRVPQYTDVTIASSGILTASDWEALSTTPTGTAGYYTGIVAFRATGKLDVQLNGGIHTTGQGYRGGAGVVGSTSAGYQGESTAGTGTNTHTENFEGGGGGGSAPYCQGGGGGSYGTAGGNGVQPGTNCGTAQPNGSDTLVGDDNLSQIFLGAGGGGGSGGYSGGWNDTGEAGGDGGGIVYIAAQEIEVDTHPVSTDGYINATGTQGGIVPNYGDIPAGGGGGGAGGSMYLLSDTSDFSGDVSGAAGTGGTTYLGARVDAWGNTGRYGTGGAGGDGRLRVDSNRVDETTTPTYVDGMTNQPFYEYGIYTSNELSTNGTADFKKIEWIETLAAYNDVQVLTRSGNTADATSGTWETWKPNTGGTNVFALDDMNTHTNWTGTNLTVAEGDITRDKNFYEDEDEATATNLTKFSTSTLNGYAAMDLGGGSEVDLSSANYVSFWIRGSKSNSNFTIGMGEAAATEQTENFTVELEDTWQKVYWDISDITGTARDSVRYFRITYTDDSTGSVDLYLDNLEGNEFFTTATGTEIQSTADNYIQYRLIFSTTSTTSSNDDPEVHAVQANYVTNSAVLYSQEGDVTRNIDYYEDEDELTAANITRVVSTSTSSEKHYVESTISSTDLSNFDYLSFWIRTSATSTEVPMRIGIGEAEGDEQTMDFIVETPFQWQKVFFDLTNIAATDKDAITKLRVTNLGPYVNDIYIDDFAANKYISISGSTIPSTVNSYLQYRAILSTTDTTEFPYLDQVSIAYSGVSDVVSKDYVANVLPRRANLISWADHGTGSVAYWASRDGGTTWTSVTMTEQATESGATKIYSGYADITSQPAGTDMRWKAQISGNAVLKSMAMRWESGGGADLAEWYPTNDPSLAPAEVISADTTSSRSAYIKRSDKAYDPTVLGIISTAPGVQIGEMAENTKRVALAGRVPVLIASDSAAIKTGDFLVSSHVPGRAMKAQKTGYTIGKALEDWNPGTDQETVMTFVNLGTHINEDDIGGIDKSSLEDIFGEGAGDILGASDSATLDEENTASGSAQTSEATGSAEASGSALLSATDSADLNQETLTSRLRNIAQERLDALFAFTGQEESTDSADLADALNIVTEDSIAKSQSSLLEARDKFVDYGSTVGNTIGASTLNAFNGLNAASATIYGRLVASSVDVYGKLTAVSGEFIDLLARRVETGELATEMISPISDGGSIHFKLGANATASGRIIVENASGSAVTTFDDKGNINTLGDLIAQNVITSTISADVATFTDASISGELDATSARIDQLESKLAQIEDLDAQTADIVNATISGTLFAADISEFGDKVAAAIEEPTLLEKLLGTADATNTVETIDNYFANHDTFVTELDTTSVTRLGIEDLTLTAEDLVIDATAIFVDQYLDVNGSAYIAENLGLGQSLVISDAMFITAGSIDYAPTGIDTPTLNIQPSGKGILSLMAGLFTLDESGAADINGDLTVAGDLKVNDTLLTNMIAANDFTNPFQVQLATMSGDVLGEETVQESRFEILNELGIAVATISAQGKADFSSGIGIGSETLEATDSAQIESEKTSGTATIKSGNSEIVIKSPIVTTQSLIYITPLGSTNNKVLYVKELSNDNPDTPELESGFKVGFDTNTTGDVKFNWWIVN
jgi:hypothetical protein